METAIVNALDTYLLNDLSKIVFEYTNHLFKFGGIFQNTPVSDYKKYNKLVKLLESSNYATIQTGLLANDKELLNFSQSSVLHCLIYYASGYAFSTLCEKGYLQVAQWLNDIERIGQDSYNRAFLVSCSAGQLSVAKWLYSLGNINIHYIMNEDEESSIYFAQEFDNSFYDSFTIACINNHLDVAKWLYKKYIPDRNKLIQILQYICYNDRLQIIKWLCKKIKYIHEIFVEDITNPFLISSMNNQYIISKWFYSLGIIKKDIVIYVFKYVCINAAHLLRMIKWLYSLVIITKNTINDIISSLSRKYTYYDSHQINLINWLKDMRTLTYL